MHSIGLDIGGTKVLGVLLAADGTIVHERRLASPHAGIDALVATGAAIVEEIGAGTAEAPAPVGIGVAGLVDRNGHLGYSPNLPLVRDAPVLEAFRAALHRPVVVDNDAAATTLGEVTYGAAAGASDVLVVTLGTGIGGGMLLGGRPYRGANNFGGEIGHFTIDPAGPRCACGERGHWEAFASGTALGRLAREYIAQRGGAEMVAAAGGDAGAVTGLHVAVAAGRGDADAQQVIVQYAEYVALGLAGLANILDPEVIVIGGGVVELGPLLFGPLRDAFMRHVEGPDYRPPIAIVPALLGERAGAIGAAVLARSAS